MLIRWTLEIELRYVWARPSCPNNNILLFYFWVNNSRYINYFLNSVIVHKRVYTHCPSFIKIIFSRIYIFFFKGYQTQRLEYLFCMLFIFISWKADICRSQSTTDEIVWGVKSALKRLHQIQNLISFTLFVRLYAFGPWVIYSLIFIICMFFLFAIFIIITIIIIIIIFFFFEEDNNYYY